MRPSALTCNKSFTQGPPDFFTPHQVIPSTLHKLLCGIGHAYVSLLIISGNVTESFQEVYIGILPFFHIYGMVAVMLTGLDHGAKIVTLPRFEPEAFLNAIYNNHVCKLFALNQFE